MKFKEIKIEDLKFNPFILIGNEWTLVTAGNEKNFNTMTASWGNLGVTWGKPTAITYIRPQRYTREFVDNNEFYTLSVFDRKYVKDLEYLGSVSGRDENKIKKTSLTPIKLENSVSFEEAKLIFICKKLYVDKIKEEKFIDKNIVLDSYKNKDFHYMYISEIVKAFIKI